MTSETDQEILHQSHGTYEPGTMDIKEHLRTWHLFLTLAKWLIVFNAGLLLFLAIFRTHN